MKEMISHHRTGLPPSLLRIFEPRPQPPHLDSIKHRKPSVPYSGVGAYLQHFAEPGDPEYQLETPETRPADPRKFANPEFAVQCRLDVPTRIERKIAEAQAAAKEHDVALQELLASYDPSKDPNIEGDPFKTLFVSRLSYDVSERKLRHEFEEFGDIKRIRLVHDKHSGKPRGYAFIEFEHKSDMKEAYKGADGRRIEGMRCLVDVERGRTVPDWRPRRLGGGKGGETRASRIPRNHNRHIECKIIDAALGHESLEPVPRGDTQQQDRAPGRGGDKPPERDAARDRAPRGREYEYGGGDRRDRGGGETRHRPHAHRQSRDGPLESSSRYYSSSRDRERDRDRDILRGGGSGGGGASDRRKRDRDDRYDDDEGRHHHRSSRGRERERHRGMAGGDYDDFDGRDYTAVPPPTSLGGGQGYVGGVLERESAERRGYNDGEYGGYGGGDGGEMVGGRGPPLSGLGVGAAAGAMNDYEPEEGEYPIEQEERDAKRPREA